MNGLIIKILILCLLPFLASLSGGAPEYLSGVASTPVMDQYSKYIEDIMEAGEPLSPDDMNALEEREKKYLESLKSSGYSVKKFYLDYFFVPVVILFFSIIWGLLGCLLSGYGLKFSVAVLLVASLFLVVLGFSYQPIVNIIFLFFGFFSQQKTPRAQKIRVIIF